MKLDVYCCKIAKLAVRFPPPPPSTEKLIVLLTSLLPGIIQTVYFYLHKDDWTSSILQRIQLFHEIFLHKSLERLPETRLEGRNKARIKSTLVTAPEMKIAANSGYLWCHKCCSITGDSSGHYEELHGVFYPHLKKMLISYWSSNKKICLAADLADNPWKEAAKTIT